MKEATFIDPESLSALRGRRLFYPCAGHDYSEFLALFADHIDEFHFCDTCTYCDLRHLRYPFSNPELYPLIDKKIEGDPIARMEDSSEARPYRYLRPGSLIEIYERARDGRRLKVVRRRGFGQYALAEFPNRSIGIFVHRGDRPVRGEGSSGVFFLANRKLDHEPLSNLFDKLTLRLADRALVISDGSNTCIKFLKAKFHNATTGAEAFERLRHEPRPFGAFDWRCVGYVSKKNGPTLVWDVMRRGTSAT